MGSKFEINFFFSKLISSAALNLILTLLFLFQSLLFLFQSLSSALKNCCIPGNQIPKIVEDAAYKRLEKGEDNSIKQEQEQEPEDR